MFDCPVTNAVLAIISVTFIYTFTGKKDKYSVRPNITWKGYAINFLLWPLQKFQLSDAFEPIKLERIKKIASKITKYDDFENDDYEKYYNFTMDLVNKAGYSPIGHAAARDFFIKRLVAKLRTNRELKSDRFKGALESPVRKPLFVFGIPRTGTTFLHRLLALDPASRAPLGYELFDPTQRYPDDLEKDAKKRCAYLQKALDVLHMVVPHFEAIHEVGTDKPEECLLAMGSDAPIFLAVFHLLLHEMKDNVRDWEPVAAYKNYAKVLQLLQYQAEVNNTEQKDKRWVLKCPAHTLWLDYLVQGFPDARLVWTHRDLNDAIPSFCSFLRACQDMYEGERYLQLDELGKDVMSSSQEFLKNAHDFYKSTPQEKNPHSSVMYKDLIKDPVGTVRNLYKELGYEFTAEYEKILTEFIAADRAQREEIKKRTGGEKKLHNYSLEMYGIEEEDVANDFAWYNKEYFA